MKISSIAIVAAALPGTAWAKFETAGRLRAARTLGEDLPLLEAASLSMHLMADGDGGEYAGKSGKEPSSKSGKAKSGKAANVVDSMCSDEYPTIDSSEAFQPLQMPHQIYPDKDGVTRVDLVWNLAHYHGPSFSTIIRGYNGMRPGPTIHVDPGGSLELKLVNCMYSPEGFSGPEAHNRYHHPNSTNLHTHGPHISGADPGDNVFVKISPREYHDYLYEFNENHMPGTFWYHPHLHGSTAVQTGSGSSGMIIMDDPEDYDIPDAIKDMPDVQIVFQHMNLPNLREASDVSQDMVTNWIDHNFEITNKTTDITNFMLANMQFLPKITMDQGKWYRWRTVMSSIKAGIAFVSESGNCEMKLLAKDGIYLTDAPRDIEAVILSPGNRADVAVRCHEPGQEYMNTTRIALDPRFGNFNPGDQYPPEGEEEDPPVDQMVGTFMDPDEQPTVLVIDVVRTQDADLEPFQAPTPCYLVDLTGVDESEIETHFIVEYACVAPGQSSPFVPPGWPFVTGPLDICGAYGPYGVGGDVAQLTPWVDENTYINDFSTGQVQEIEHPGNAFHPYHQHINPFQITEIVLGPNGPPLQDFVANYYQVGDWHDTLQLPNAGPPPPGFVKMRFQSDQFGGHMVQHCHLLFHEDQGMMAQYDVTGEEGAVWPGAKLIDPTCIPAQ